MMRLIDADVFEIVFFENKSEEFVDGATYVLEMIDNAPTVKTRPLVYGYVKTIVGNMGVMHQECSVCGEVLEWKEYPNFCPNCGADIRKKVE